MLQAPIDNDDWIRNNARFNNLWVFFAMYINNHFGILKLKLRLVSKLRRTIVFFPSSLYIYIYGEIVDFGKSDKTIKISVKVDKWNAHNGFSSIISFFIQESEEVLPWIKNEILQPNLSMFSH